MKQQTIVSFYFILNEFIEMKYRKYWSNISVGIIITELIFIPLVNMIYHNLYRSIFEYTLSRANYICRITISTLLRLVATHKISMYNVTQHLHIWLSTLQKQNLAFVILYFITFVMGTKWCRFFVVL